MSLLPCPLVFLHYIQCEALLLSPPSRVSGRIEGLSFSCHGIHSRKQNDEASQQRALR